MSGKTFAKFSTNASFAEQIEQLFGLEIPEHQIQVALKKMTSKGIVSRPAGTNIVLNVELRQEIQGKINPLNKVMVTFDQASGYGQQLQNREFWGMDGKKCITSRE